MGPKSNSFFSRAAPIIERWKASRPQPPCVLNGESKQPAPRPDRRAARRGGATHPAPATLRETIDRAEERYGISLPLADLFRWGTDPAAREAIKGAIYVGPALLGGDPCDHFAFRQEGADWQIWIQRGDFPLPRKLVITTTDDEARPQYTNEMDWNLAPSLNEKMFTFEPPPDSYRISIQEIMAEPAPGK